MSIESVCQKVLELFDDLSETAETLSLIEKGEKALPILAEMKAKAAALHDYLFRGGGAAGNKNRKTKCDSDDEDDDNGDHISLENGRSVDFERQKNGIERMKRKKRRDSWTCD